MIGLKKARFRKGCDSLRCSEGRVFEDTDIMYLTSRDILHNRILFPIISMYRIVKLKGI